MKYAYIKLNTNNHECKGRSVIFKTMYGDVRIPESKVEVIGSTAIVATIEFAKRGSNACLMISGYLGLRDCVYRI